MEIGAIEEASASSPQRLKPRSILVAADAALKGPLFHGEAGFCALLRNLQDRP